METQKIELILFYVEWCSHCRALVGNPDQAWNQLEALYANHPTVQIRKIGETEFESYDHEATTYQKPKIDHFPMIIRVEGKNCQVYDRQDRSVEDFKRFLEEPRLLNQVVNTCRIL